MRKSRLMLLLVSFFIAAAGFAENSNEKITLKMRLEPGEVFRYHQVYSETVTQNLPGAEESGIYQSEYEYINVLEVKEVYRNGSFLIRASFEYIRTTQDGPQGKRSFSSDDPLSKVTLLDIPLAIAAAHSFEVKFFPNGKVKVIKGYEDSIKLFLKNMDFSQFPKGTKDFVEKLCDDAIGDRALEEMLQNDIYPEDQVRVGDSWKIENLFTKGLPLIASSTLTLKARNNGILTVAKTSQIKSNLDAPPALVFDDYALKYDFIGAETSLFEIFESNGMIKRYQNERELSGELLPVKGPQDFKSRKMPFHLKSSTLIEYMPEGPAKP